MCKTQAMLMQLQRKGLFSCCSFAEGTLPSLALFRDGLMGRDSWTIGLPTGFMSGLFKGRQPFFALDK